MNAAASVYTRVSTRDMRLNIHQTWRNIPDVYIETFFFMTNNTALTAKIATISQF